MRRRAMRVIDEHSIATVATSRNDAQRNGATMKFYRIWALIERDMRKFFRSPALMMAR